MKIFGSGLTKIVEIHVFHYSCFSPDLQVSRGHVQTNCYYFLRETSCLRAFVVYFLIIHCRQDSKAQRILVLAGRCSETIAIPL